MKKKLIGLLTCVSVLVTATINSNAMTLFTPGDSQEDTQIKLETTVCTEQNSGYTYVENGYVDDSGDKTYNKSTHGDWAQVPELINFVDKNNNYWIAYTDEDTLFLQKVLPKGSETIIRIKKEYPLLGDVICDDEDNFYVVWGQIDTSYCGIPDILSVSKYDSQGTLVKTVNFESDPNAELTSYAITQEPFRGGSCDTVISNGVLVANLARLMYNGHQSNAIIAVNIDDMSINYNYCNYASHSFDQRVLAKRNGDIIFANLGDAYPRGFTCGIDSDVYFHFYGELGANATYAQLGDICEFGDDILLVGTAPKLLEYNERMKYADLFIQLVSDERVLPNSEERSGYSAGETVTDKGVVWLTNYDDTMSARNPQMVKIDENSCVILWEKYKGDYLDTYYTIVDKEGNQIVEPTSLEKQRLNTFEPPVLVGKKLIWVTAGHFDYTTVRTDTEFFRAYKIFDGDKATLHSLDVSEYIRVMPSVAPTTIVTKDVPDASPTAEPTAIPTATPTTAPTVTPTDIPKEIVRLPYGYSIERLLEEYPDFREEYESIKDNIIVITVTPTIAPTAAPTNTAMPTNTTIPSDGTIVTFTPTIAPTATVVPTKAATITIAPTDLPTASPTVRPTTSPAARPTATSTVTPTPAITEKPSDDSKLQKGIKFKTSKYVYQITDVKKKYVKLVQPVNKTIKSAKIEAKVKYKGTQYKVVSINTKAFRKCKKLRSVTIGSNISSIGSYAFDGCSNLRKIKIESKRIKVIGKGAFRAVNKHAKISIPKSKKNAYKKALRKSGISKSIKITS